MARVWLFSPTIINTLCLYFSVKKKTRQLRRVIYVFGLSQGYLISAAFFRKLDSPAFMRM